MAIASSIVCSLLPLSNPLTHLHRTSAQDHAHPFTRGPNDEGRRRHRPPPMGTTTDIDSPPHPRTLTAHVRRRPPPKYDNRPRRTSTHGQRRPLPPLTEDDDPLHGWTTSPTPWTDGHHPRPTNNDPKPSPPAPATPYGQPPLVNHDRPRTKTAHGLRRPPAHGR
jgi:hypothetical protein